MRWLLSFLAILCAVLAGSPARAQDTETPYWASLRVDEVNMRVGPGEDYRIAWVFRRPMLPVKVLRLMDGWRLVEDPSGEKGWMLARFLSRDRGAIVIGKSPADLRESGDASAAVLWRLRPGVVGRLGTCDAGWCRFDVDKRGGFIAQKDVWGAGEP
jgi:SH3-like domain-containing protein